MTILSSSRRSREEMDVWIWVAIGFLIFLVVASLGAFLYIRLRDGGDSPSGCDQTRQDPKCLYYLEKFSDSTITTPTQPLYLGTFTYSQGAGAALCQPMWYAFRYVRQSDGGYGPLSPWTTTPIFAGSCNLPCAPTVCGTNLVPPANNSQASVTYNSPEVVTVSTLDYPLYQGYVANVHRYLGADSTTPPPPGTEGTIVGTLFPVTNNSYGFTGTCTDVAFNPNPSGGSTCNPLTCPSS